MQAAVLPECRRQPACGGRNLNKACVARKRMTHPPYRRRRLGSHAGRVVASCPGRSGRSRRILPLLFPQQAECKHRQERQRHESRDAERSANERIGVQQ